jgi:hypothetical protein
MDSDKEREKREQQTILDHLDKADPDVWLLLMNNMVATLVTDDQILLAKLIGREAERRAERGQGRPSDCLNGVLRDCGLRIRLES